MAGFGGAVKLTGESEYRKALKNITQNLREVSSEMKLVSAQYGKNDTSTQSLTAKSEVLSKKLEQQKQKVSVLKKQYAEMAQQYETNKTKNDALAKKYDEEKKKLDILGRTLGTTSTEYKEQEKVVSDLGEELKKSEANQDKNARTMSNLRIQLNGAEADVAQTTREIDTMAREMDKSSDAGDELGNSMQNASEGAEKANSGFTVFKGALANLVSNVIQNAISKMQELVTNTIEVGAKFEDSMAKVQAISGSSNKDMQKLSETAKKFGSTTKFSASESADALGYMALAGWDANKSADALGGVLNLASASGMDLAKASDMVTDYLSAFGLSADKSTYFADMLSYAQGNANTTAEQLGEAYKNCASVMHSSGQDVETTTALLSMLANQGLKGSEAGTALSAMMRDITSKMKDGKIAIGDTLVAVQDSQGNFRDLSDILKDVDKATQGMGDAQKASALQSTFTADSIKGLNMILNGGVDNANKFEEALRNSDGTAQKMADTMNNTLNGDMTTLGSKVEGVQIALYEKLEPALRTGVQALQGLADAMQWLINHGTEVSSVIIGIATATATYIAFSTALKVMEEGWKALTIVTKLQAGAQAVLNAVMSANPIGVVIALIAGLVVAFMTLWNNSETFRNFWIGLWDNIVNAVSPAIDAIKSTFSTVWDTVKSIWSGAVSFFSSVISGIIAVFTPVASVISNVFGVAWAGVQAVWNIAGSYFSAVWGTIKGIFAVVKAVLSGNFGDAWSAIKGIVNGWTNYFSTIWNTIKGIFNPVISFFRNVFSGAWNAIKNVFSPFASFFSGLWSRIAGTFKGLGTTIGNAIGGAVKSAINGVISAIENTINHAIGLINSAIGLINKLPGVHVGNVGNLRLPRLAKGGVVNSPTIAEIGEAGKEAVIPLENNLGWLTRMAELLAKNLVPTLSEMSRNVNSANYNNNNNYNDTVNAFKDALGQMKIVLDDEEMGHFIEKTVSDAIYT